MAAKLLWCPPSSKINKTLNFSLPCSLKNLTHAFIKWPIQAHFSNDINEQLQGDWVMNQGIGVEGTEVFLWADAIVNCAQVRTDFVAVFNSAYSEWKRTSCKQMNKGIKGLPRRLCLILLWFTDSVQKFDLSCTSMSKADFQFGKSLKYASKYHWANGHGCLCWHTFRWKRTNKDIRNILYFTLLIHLCNYSQ